MKVYGRLIAMAAATLIAGSAAAQEPPTQTRPPQARQRLHTPGTGQQEGMIPQRLQLGRRGGGIGPGAGGLAPGALLARRDFLGLTEKQIEELRALETQLAEQRDQALADVRARQQELRDAWSAEDPDPSLVREKMKAAMDAQQSFALARVDAGAKAQAVLDAEQLGKVRGLAEGYRMGRGGRGGTGGFRGSHGLRGAPGRGMMRGGRQAVPPRGRRQIP